MEYANSPHLPDNKQMQHRGDAAKLAAEQAAAFARTDEARQDVKDTGRLRNLAKAAAVARQNEAVCSAYAAEQNEEAS